MNFLRPYQKEAIAQLKQCLREGKKRPILVAPTAFGKTITAAAIIKGALEKNKTVLFLAPRRELIYQTIKEFEGLGITTSVIMAGEPLGYSMGKCKVASIDTLLSRAIRTDKMQLPKVDILLIDEVHLMVSTERKKLIDAYSDALILGFTATPALPNNRSMGDVFDALIMTHDIGQLTADGFLAPLRYYGGSCTDVSKLKLNKDGDYEEKSLGKAMDDPKLIGDIYTNWKRIAGNKQTVVFCVTCAHAQHVYEEFIRNGVKAEYVDGKTDKDERKERLNRIETRESQVLVNCQIATYGLNIPCLECCVLAKPSKSLVSYIQSVGRVLRICEGKIEAILIDHAGAVELHGFVCDPIPWSLDGNTTVTERKEKAAQERKEPKEITCKNCGYIFKSRTDCPKCGMVMIQKGEAIPYHEAELVEIKKPKPQDKTQFYAELLGYCRRQGKNDKYALAIFHERFGEWPYHKFSIKPCEPSQDTLNYIKHQQIKWAKRRTAA